MRYRILLVMLMRKPSVLMVCLVIPPAYGGAGNQAMSLASALASTGCSVRLVGAASRGARRRETIRGVMVRRLGTTWSGRAGRLAFYGSLLVYALFRRHKYDVVHVHGVFWHAVLCAFVARLTGAPFILKMTRMGDDDVATLERLRRKNFVGALRAWPLRVARLLVALNSVMLYDCKLSGLELPCELLPNGIDTYFWHPPKNSERKFAREQFSVTGQVVLFSGGLLRHKGLVFLLQGLSLIQRRTTLFVVGPQDPVNSEVDSELAKKLEAWEFSNNELNRVVRLGLVDQELMRQLYWAADVYVLPTEREGNPNALLEAMACGVGCIATKIHGIIDTGMPEECYLGVEPGNVQELKKAMDLLADGARRITIGAFAARYILEDRSIVRLAAHYEMIYQKLLGDYG